MVALQFYGHLLQIYGFEPTVLWSSATEIWCHPQAPGLVATDLWSQAFATPLEALLLQIYGRRPGPGSCYRFMVASAPGDSATDLWSLARWLDVTTKFAR